MVTTTLRLDRWLAEAEDLLCDTRRLTLDNAMGQTVAAAAGALRAGRPHWSAAMADRPPMRSTSWAR